MNTIKKLGKALCSINLLIVGDDTLNVFEKPMIDYIIEGCPKLKTLTLESLRGWNVSTMSKFFASDFWDLIINKENFEALYKGCKELKDVKLTKVLFEDISNENEIKKILPDCNVEIKECEFRELHPSSDDSSSDDFSSDSDDWSDSSSNDFSSDSDDWFDKLWGDISSDEEQESNSEGAYEADEINGNLKKSDGEDNLYF